MKPPSIGKSRTFKRGNQTETLTEISGASVTAGVKKAAGLFYVFGTQSVSLHAGFGLRPALLVGREYGTAGGLGI
jgi:hypothetical protein